MSQKFDPALHAKIRQMFPLEVGTSHVIEILTTEPLSYKATKYTDPDILCEHTFDLSMNDTPYFLIDSIVYDEPIFLYRDAGVTFEQSYKTQKTIRYKTRNPIGEVNLEDVRKDLIQLENLLKAKAS